ncbi:Two-component response regulator, SAPR family, consists of REC, wHTH and BTAD domains [Paenibacillus sp. yr247]|uniref:response regulator n=1 Tax=Paenibacillus sp. yr247 TaxID=1761880 RepID=UPI000882B9BF|nr:response regulator [Paenibacillus sp. yr247]SDO16629.1 Two-component response regulator, SAPR family, consists of REC, wHTH and BTAD domains [Paenibacillus sp. yr247]
MKVVIIDDEMAMHLIMKRMLAKVVGVEVVAIFQETTTAFAYLTDHHADLIFIDISMPKESGLEFAQRLRENGRQMKLVFVTSHKEYALAAFDVYAFDYIVKPVNQERLHHTVQRTLSEMRLEKESAEQKPSSTSSIRVMFNCLGGMEIRTVQNVIVKWKTSKSAELFGYLLMHKGRLVSRARIIEDMFGEMPQKNSEIYLNTTVYQLRKLLDNYGLKGNLYSDSNYYALDFNQIGVDSLSFEEGCKQMAVLDETNIEQALELQELYKGELFGERAFPWAWSEVERISLMYTSFTQRLCSALLIKGDSQTAIRLLMKLAAHNELEEETIKLLMKAMALQKNKDALTERYEQFTGTLHKEFGISPSLEVTTLYSQLLSELDQ